MPEDEVPLGGGPEMTTEPAEPVPSADEPMFTPPTMEHITAGLDRTDIETRDVGPRVRGD